MAPQPNSTPCGATADDAFERLEFVHRMSTQLSRDQEISFLHIVPSRSGALRVQVTVESNLDVLVTSTGSDEAAELRGGYFMGQVHWLDDHEPTLLLCTTARAMVASIVEDVLSVFTRGYLLASRWTSYDYAASELRPPEDT